MLSQPDHRGVRHIPPTMKEARMGFIPTKTNRTPCISARINALINYLWKKKNNTERNISKAEQKLVSLQFHMYTRQCRLIMKSEGINEPNWGKLPAQQKLYYSLRLEELIFSNYHYPIYECVDRWAASLLLQDVMKAERKTDKRRRVCIQHSIVILCD